MVQCLAHSNSSVNVIYHKHFKKFIHSVNILVLGMCSVGSVLGPRYTAEEKPSPHETYLPGKSEKQTLKIKIVKCMGYKIVISAAWKHKRGQAVENVCMSEHGVEGRSHYLSVVVNKDLSKRVRFKQKLKNLRK